jgi:predicted nucleic acid-binding protein
LSELQGNTALDSSVLVEYLTGSPVGNVLREYFKRLSPNETVSVSLFTLAETFYVLCRMKGQRFAYEKIHQVLSSAAIEVFNSIDLAIEVGKLKCERSISLADCSCLATAMQAKARAIFAFREDELLREMRRRSFDVEIVFLEDLSSKGLTDG